MPDNVKKSEPYLIKDFSAAKKILMLIDGYRKLNFEDFKWADTVVKEGKMGKRFASEWRKTREILLKFAREAGSQTDLLNLAALQQILLQVGLIVSAITMLLSTLVAMSFAFHLEWAKGFQEIFVYAIIPLAIGLMATFLGPPLIARRISAKLERIFARKQDFVKKFDDELKCFAQKLIDSMIYSIKNGEIEIKKKKEHELGLFNLDYKGIKVVKKPYFFRKYYIVILDF